MKGLRLKRKVSLNILLYNCSFGCVVEMRNARLLPKFKIDKMEEILIGSYRVCIFWIL
ncbi:hypothetical protein MTR_7g017080 [Medicago truncatula]|uniref:Uncharacterized protein n=1 Tax=Medicago truncatula TaxID=3880 RepID=G7KR52_MEDTR|nr:hypothetical protein MTR_7g017080 [Medicago truncatula]